MKSKLNEQNCSSKTSPSRIELESKTAKEITSFASLFSLISVNKLLIDDQTHRKLEDRHLKIRCTDHFVLLVLMQTNQGHIKKCFAGAGPCWGNAGS